MYESPIVMKIKSEMDARLLRAVVEAGVTIDKEELFKALAYDRGQYEKGYEDGKQDAVLTVERDRYNEGYAKGTQDAMELMVARANGDTVPSNCNLCLYHPVCKLWGEAECQDANSYLTGGMGSCPLFLTLDDVARKGNGCNG